MAHVDPKILDAHVSHAPVRARDLRHIDGCVACRRAATERGIPVERLSALLDARRSRGRGLIAAGVLATAVGVAAVAFPLRGAATGFLAAFEPHRVAALPLTLDDLRSLGNMPDFSAYAATRDLRAPTSASYTDVRAAMAAAGFGVRQPASVGAIRAMSFHVNGPSTQLLTFGANRSDRRTAARPLPPDIAGSTLRIDIGATVVATYTTAATAADELRLRAALQRMTTTSQSRNSITYRIGSPARPIAPGGPANHVTGHLSIVRNPVQGSAAAPATHGWGFSFKDGTLPLVVVQMPVPRIATTGVSIARLASFMLSQPGVSPRVTAAFGALGDLATTLPIPVPIDKAYTQPVLVDGVQGVGLGDDTGIGAAVVWQKSGMLYAVFATQTARNVLAIANTLQ